MQKEANPNACKAAPNKLTIELKPGRVGRLRGVGDIFYSVGLVDM